MIKWFKSLSKQEKLMALLIVVLLIGVALRWDNLKKKALIWFRYDDIMEERQAADSIAEVRSELPASDSMSIVYVSETDTIR